MAGLIWPHRAKEAETQSKNTEITIVNSTIQAPISEPVEKGFHLPVGAASWRAFLAIPNSVK